MYSIFHDIFYLVIKYLYLENLICFGLHDILDVFTKKLFFCISSIAAFPFSVSFSVLKQDKSSKLCLLCICINIIIKTRNLVTFRFLKKDSQLIVLFLKQIIKVVLCRFERRSFLWLFSSSNLSFTTTISRQNNVPVV